MYLRRHEGLVSANWRGGCAGGMAGGLADGDGLLEFVNRNNRVIRKVTMRQGREQGQGETYAVNDSGGFAGYSVAEKAWKPLPREHLPQWARHFLDAHRGAVAVVQAAPPAPPAPAPAQASAAQEARIAEIRRREEEEEAQRRHEEEREERRRRREEREEEERAERDRNNRYMEAMGAIMKGAAEGRRQAEERRRAQVAEIERQNERYRQQRSAEDRRWVEEQQRQRAQEAERQRAQEAQRQQVARAEQARAQPRWQRVNLPAHTGCISVQWRPSAPQNVDQWYEIRNGCPMTLNVHWCARQGCTESTSMATIAGGGSTKSWTLKKYGPSVSVIIACQVDNGGRTVHFDRRNGQCWSDVQMQ
jgi:hypothetical protein